MRLRILCILALLATTGVLVVTSAVADPAGEPDSDPAGIDTAGYALWWRTIDGGGASFVYGGDYRLGGTIGQPDAAGKVSDGLYTLEGGFWVTAPGTYHAFLPAVLRAVP